MTHRLYYDQTYLRAFDAQVLEVRREQARALLRLDRSAFYPTSGGQPYDTGTLGGEAVRDVFVDEAGEVWHALRPETPLQAGDSVHGEIDWARRFDHMQQHGGEHLLAGMVYRQLGGATIGLHLGAQDSTIDVTLPDGRTRLTEIELAALEDEVNLHIEEDLPIRCWFPSPDELAALPLRKAPTVTGHVRVVAMGEVEMVACGGTHPSSTGQIGLLKILDATPARGKLRLRFVCGMRALQDYRMVRTGAEKAACLLSAKLDHLPASVQSLKDELSSLRRELAETRRQQALARVQALYDRAEPLPDGARLVTASLGDVTPESLREVASSLIERPRTLALLAAARPDGGFQLLFARSADLTADMGALLRACGAKGGGKPDFAQGSAPQAEPVFANARAALERPDGSSSKEK